jgi:hypothetical protein
VAVTAAGDFADAALCVPVVTLGSDLLWQKFLAADYAASQQLIDNTAGQTDKLNPAVAAAPDNRGMVDTLKDWLAKNGDVTKHVENLKRAAEQATEHIIRLIVIFVLQTLVIPLLLLWALYAFVRQVFERPWQRRAALAACTAFRQLPSLSSPYATPAFSPLRRSVMHPA